MFAARAAQGPAAQGARAASGETLRVAFKVAKRKFASEVPRLAKVALGTVTVALAAAPVFLIDGTSPAYIAQVKKNEKAIRAAIAETMDGDTYDGHGSYGPVFIRLAWHAAGTYDTATKTGEYPFHSAPLVGLTPSLRPLATLSPPSSPALSLLAPGGSNGASMRFSPESGHGANAGLAIARERLEIVKKRFPFISYADLWTLAGCVAVQEMGGPEVKWRPGRSDYDPKAFQCPPDGRLPDASKAAPHVRDVFYRMGFNDQEIVALIGAHAVGKCHTDRSGYDGPWTRSPTTFSNAFFTVLKDEKWQVRDWKGPKQFQNAGGKDLMMLPADMAFLSDPAFRKHVDVYAADEQRFFGDFAKAFTKLLELGVPFPAGAADPPAEPPSLAQEGLMQMAWDFGASAVGAVVSIFK